MYIEYFSSYDRSTVIEHLYQQFKKQRTAKDLRFRLHISFRPDKEIDLSSFHTLCHTKSVHPHSKTDHVQMTFSENKGGL